MNRIIIQLIAAMLLSLPTALLADQKEGFDHATTGFMLTGRHVSTDCESCHGSGIFRGTPRQCVSCHLQQEMAGSEVKSVNHIASSNLCEDCHNTYSWQSVRRFDHSAAIGNCISCHNGVQTSGKPASHAITSDQCEQCHRTSMWGATWFKHTDVIPGQCETCHDGSVAPGKNSSHIPTTLSCDDCHSTRAWIPAGFNHANVNPGQCTTCHNGVTATGKNIGHLTTTASCDACHTTRAWLPAEYTHSSPNYPKHGINLDCNDCHASSSYIIAWAFPPPDCITCHENDFREEHDSGERASLHYCTSCHEHQDSLTSGSW